jgi:hypothetical protein
MRWLTSASMHAVHTGESHQQIYKPVASKQPPMATIMMQPTNHRHDATPQTLRPYQLPPARRGLSQPPLATTTTATPNAHPTPSRLP